MKGNGTALVLSGGGARGAYQAGVLFGLLERGILPPGCCPFKILVGTSAGSIHATTLAARADEFDQAVLELMEVWSRIRARHVFKTDYRSIGKIAYTWARDLGFGGLLGQVSPKSLLNTAPLSRIFAGIPFKQIQGQIDKDNLLALAVPTTEYFSNQNVIWLQGKPDLPDWSKKRRTRVERTKIGVQHILASSAIPMLFPSVQIDGRHFGDGCIRNHTPLGPAIRLGADKILAIGVHEPAGLSEDRKPMVADIAATMLDAVMMDAMETDVAHCNRINENLHKNKGSKDFRKVDVMWLAPSLPIAPLARQLMHRIPAPVRYLLRGLGGDRSASELATYLLFHPDFCGRLLHLGRYDVQQREDEIEAFLYG